MGEMTAISWCDHTFSPWRVCSHATFPSGSGRAGEVHPGCLNCYAEATNNFHRAWNGGQWGPGAPRVVAADSAWANVHRWARAAAADEERRRCFFSLGDPLDEEAPVEAQERFWDLIRDTAHATSGPDMLSMEPDGPPYGLDWLLLTKRPWRWELIPEDVRPLVWLGTSISDQATADVWVPELLRAEGFRLRFISAEPLLGPIDMSAYFGGPYVGLPGDQVHDSYNFGLDWVIAGGESGAERRPAEVAWYASLADQCAAAGVAFWMKQDTAYRAGQQGRIPEPLWARKELPRG